MVTSTAVDHPLNWPKRTTAKRTQNRVDDRGDDAHPEIRLSAVGL